MILRYFSKKQIGETLLSSTIKNRHIAHPYPHPHINQINAAVENSFQKKRIHKFSLYAFHDIAVAGEPVRYRDFTMKRFPGQQWASRESVSEGRISVTLRMYWEKVSWLFWLRGREEQLLFPSKNGKGHYHTTLYGCVSPICPQGGKKKKRERANERREGLDKFWK